MSADPAHVLTRRQLIGAGAGAGAALLAGGLASRALAAGESLADRRLRSEVRHIIVLTQENRSFDTYFGTLRGVIGYDDPNAVTLPSGKSVFYQPAPNSVGYELPFHMDTTTTSSACVADLSHAWTVQHQARDDGRMDDWVPAHIAADGPTNGPLTMGYYQRGDIPYHYALADAFTICDGYHASVMGPTNPNRLYIFTGMIDPTGAHGGPVIDNSETPPYTWTTYAERLQAAGITWRVYQQGPGLANGDDNPLAWFKQFQDAPASSPLSQRGMAFQNSLVDRFVEDLATDRLPQVSWIVGPDATTEHPSHLLANGAEFINEIVTALRENPKVWRHTVLLINYDENDGFFDHVSPPTAPPGTPGEYISPVPPAAGGINGPIGLGYRVPMILVSPWSTGGFACGDTFDHTSCIRLMERVFGVREPNISQWRRMTCGDLVSAFDFSRPAAEFPDLPTPDSFPTPGNEGLVDEQENACFAAPAASPLPPPAPPSPDAQTFPTQEPGTRPRRGASRAAPASSARRRAPVAHRRRRVR